MNLTKLSSEKLFSELTRLKKVLKESLVCHRTTGDLKRNSILVNCYLFHRKVVLNFSMYFFVLRLLFHLNAIIGMPFKPMSLQLEPPVFAT